MHVAAEDGMLRLIHYYDRWAGVDCDTVARVFLAMPAFDRPAQTGAVGRAVGQAAGRGCGFLGMGSGGLMFTPGLEHGRGILPTMGEDVPEIYRALADFVWNDGAVLRAGHYRGVLDQTVGL